MATVTADPLVQAALLENVGHRPPLLGAVLEAQRSAAHLLAGDLIGDSARLLVNFAAERGYPVLTPASAMASRLIGAAVLIGGGAVRATSEGTVPLGEHLLVVEAVAVGAAGLLGARELMFRLGAARVDMVALRLPPGIAHDVHVLIPDPVKLTLATT